MRLRIGSYNIRKAVGIDRRRDPARILDVVNDLGADVIVLQEADLRLGARRSALPRFLIEQETEFTVADLARTDVSLGWHGNAMLLRKDLEPSTLGHIDLPGLEPRGAVFVRFAEGQTIVGTHLGLLRRWRQRQMKSILDHLGGAVSRTVVAGDFNEWSIAGGFEPWEHDLAVATPGPSFHVTRAVAPLDRFAVGRSVALAGSWVHRVGRARVASDHFPVVAEVEFPSS